MMDVAPQESGGPAILVLGQQEHGVLAQCGKQPLLEAQERDAGERPVQVPEDWDGVGSVGDLKWDYHREAPACLQHGNAMYEEGGPRAGEP